MNSIHELKPLTGKPPAPEAFRLQATFEQAGVGLCHVAPDGRILDVNPRLCEILGYPKQMLQGRNMLDLTHPDDRPPCEEYLGQLVAGDDDGRPRNCEKRFLRKNGDAVWIAVCLKAVRDAAGAPDYFVATMQDVTDRREAEVHFRATFEQAAAGIAHMSLDGRYLRANQKLCDLLGYTQEELRGKTARDVSHPDDYREGLARRQRLLAGEAVEICAEKRYLRKDGTVVYANRSASLVRGPSGEPSYILAVVTDITPQKLAEQVLRESEQRFRAIFDHSEVGVSMRDSVDRSRRWSHVNDAFCRMLGYSREELLQLNTIDITPQEDQARAEEDNESLRSGETASYSREKRMRRKDGSLIWVQLAVAALPDPSGRPANVICIYQDITHRKLAEQALRESEQRFRAVFDHAGVGITMRSAHDRRSPWTQVNDHFCRMLGYTHEELLRLSTADITPPEELDRSVDDNDHLRRGDITSYAREKRVLRKDGQSIWVMLAVAALQDDQGRPEKVISVYQDITERKLAEQALLESEEKFRQLAENIPQVFWLSDADQKSVIYVSPAYEQITGRSLAELQQDPRSWHNAVHPDDRERVRKARRHNASAGTYDIEYRVVHTDGTVRWIHDRAFPIHNARGEAYRIAGIGEDITERKLAEQQLVQLAHYDTLTGLPNRALFHDRLQQTLTQARRNGWTVGVMFLDLDRFKLVNDTLGHASGDRLLQQAAERLTQCLRPGDTAGRLSGDEFAVILSALAATQDAGLVAQRILNAFARPFDLDGNEVFVSASIGITLYPADNEDADVLMRNADAAMYSAKSLGRNNYQYYTAEMNERAVAKLQLESRLRRALEREEFVLHFQPKVAIADGSIAGLEALLRWQSPDNGLVSPDQFVPLLEETGLIVPVGEWVLRAACAQIRAWQDAGIQPVPVAVNVSARQLQQKALVSTLTSALGDHGIEPRWIEIEITESSLMDDPDAAIAVLKEIKALGVRLSVDDFGTGYSSLGYLKRFPLDSLKIDRSFVRDITTDPEDATIARTVITLAHSLGLRVVAEGVETEEQLALLGANRCDEAQGYLFSRPLPGHDCAALLAAGLYLREPRPAGAAADAPAVLLVDDDPDHLMLTLRLLQKDGHRILTASTPQEAFDLLAMHDVKLVVSDQRMPDMPGEEFLRRVKLMYPDTGRIMLSGVGDFGTATAAINIGEAHKFFVKSRDDELLRSEVRRILQRDT